MIKNRLLTVLLITLPFVGFSQENSPFSRYGIGNLSPQGNVLNRGMGGISAGFSDVTTVNFLNPASYANLIYTTLDIGAEFDSRVLKITTPADKYTSNNAFISYLQLGIPLLRNNKKAIANNVAWGLNFGLRPISKVNYKIEKDVRTNIDSLITLYEGSGGAYEAFIGTGVKIKNLSFGLNAGYLFGNKNYSTRLVFFNDSINYIKSNSSNETHFGGIFVNGGIQYAVDINKDIPEKRAILRLGAYGNLQKSFSASQNILRETFIYNSTTGAPSRLDSVYEVNDVKGLLQMPATYGAGFTYENKKWLFGLDFETTNWSSYRFYGQKDSVKNNWTVKGGFQFLPADVNSKKYWDFVKYRAGFYFGPDYITAGKSLPQFGVTFGAGLPLKLRKSFYETQFSLMNVALEYSNRGNNNNNIRESVFRLSVGFSLSDIWFRRYKYD